MHQKSKAMDKCGKIMRDGLFCSLCGENFNPIQNKDKVLAFSFYGTSQMEDRVFSMIEFVCPSCGSLNRADHLFSKKASAKSLKSELNLYKN